MTWLGTDLVELFPSNYAIADAASLVAAWASLAAIMAFLACIVATCMLTFRLMKNLHIVAPDDVRTSATMSVLWYFIPVANLLKPARVVGEIWRATFNNVEEYGKDSGVVGLWWFAWVVWGFASRIQDRIMAESGAFAPDITAFDPELYTAGLWVGVVASIVGAIACLLYLSVFGQITRGQRRLVSSASSTKAGVA